MGRKTRRATRKSGGGFFDFLFGSSEEKKNEMNMGVAPEPVMAPAPAPLTVPNTSVASPASTMMGGKRLRKSRKVSKKSRKSRKVSKKSRKSHRKAHRASRRH